MNDSEDDFDHDMEGSDHELDHGASNEDNDTKIMIRIAYNILEWSYRCYMHKIFFFPGCVSNNR